MKGCKFSSNYITYNISLLGCRSVQTSA